jgi:hypothetical protein
VLNRHAIVLLVGNAALSLLRPYPAASYSLLGAGLLLVGVSLLLDNGESGARSRVSHAIGLIGGATLLTAVAVSIRAGALPLHFLLAQLGVCLAVVGLVLELELAYRHLRTAISIQAVGDALYLGAFGPAIFDRAQVPSRAGWIFIGLIGSVAVYAAFSNLVLQLKRLKNPQAGWRFRVIGQDAQALRLGTPAGEVGIDWSDIEAVRRLDRRQLVLVLPSPLPDPLARKDLPLEALRADPGIVDPKVAPERYGLILHEQEIGLPLADAEAGLGARLSRSNRAQ